MSKLPMPCYSFYILELQNTCQVSVGVFKVFINYLYPHDLGGKKISGPLLILTGKSLVCMQRSLQVHGPLVLGIKTWYNHTELYYLAVFIKVIYPFDLVSIIFKIPGNSCPERESCK